MNIHVAAWYSIHRHNWYYATRTFMQNQNNFGGVRYSLFRDKKWVRTWQCRLEIYFEIFRQFKCLHWLDNRGEITEYLDAYSLCNECIKCWPGKYTAYSYIFDRVYCLYLIRIDLCIEYTNGSMHITMYTVVYLHYHIYYKYFRRL